MVEAIKIKKGNISAFDLRIPYKDGSAINGVIKGANCFIEFRSLCLDASPFDWENVVIF